MSNKKSITKWELFNYGTMLLLVGFIAYLHFSGGVVVKEYYLIDYNTGEIRELGDENEASKWLNNWYNSKTVLEIRNKSNSTSGGEEWAGLKIDNLSSLSGN